MIIVNFEAMVYAKEFCWRCFEKCLDEIYHFYFKEKIKFHI